jgi:hypothetical protein
MPSYQPFEECQVASARLGATPLAYSAACPSLKRGQASANQGQKGGWHCWRQQQGSPDAQQPRCPDEQLFFMANLLCLCLSGHAYHLQAVRCARLSGCPLALKWSLIATPSMGAMNPTLELGQQDTPFTRPASQHYNQQPLPMFLCLSARA